MDIKNLTTRSASGVVYVALIVGLYLAGDIWFALLMMAFAALGVAEYDKLLNGKAQTPARLFALSLDLAGAISIVATTVWRIFLPVVLMYIVLRLIAALYDRGEQPFERLMRSFGAQVYISLPLTLTALLATPLGRFVAGPAAGLCMFILIWLNDTGAFLTGSMLGRHRLFERLSPKKSWEGFAGGMLFCIIFGIIMTMVFDVNLSAAAGGVLGACVSIAATYGDLAESMMKRNLGVKDSGSLIPGHGGILDRIDSLLLVAPVTWLFLFLI
ncbi:MAG: phosphatidate cytidylyltransferase [Muribaculaceae bacterium]|nr:phosphatidate cytidylyltransferase [Muribaculaceae bacterium]